MVARAQDRVDEVGGGRQDVLAVVEHEQQTPARQRRRRCSSVTDASGAGRDAQRGRHRVGHGRGVADGGQLDQPDPVGELVRQLGGDLDGQAGLADAAHAGEGHQPVGAHQLADLLHLELAADEAGELHRQVPGRGVERPQRRERRLQPVGAHLEQALRRRQVPQAVLAQVEQVDAGHQRGRGVAHQDLAAVTGGHHPGDAVQRRPEVVAVALVRPRRWPPPCAPAARACRWASTAASIAAPGRREHGAHPVAGVLEHRAAVRLDDRPQHARRGSPGRPASRPASASHIRVEPSMSVNRKVTVRAGRSAMASGSHTPFRTAGLPATSAAAARPFSKSWSWASRVMEKSVALWPVVSTKIVRAITAGSSRWAWSYQCVNVVTIASVSDTSPVAWWSTAPGCFSAESLMPMVSQRSGLPVGAVEHLQREVRQHPAVDQPRRLARSPAAAAPG